MDLCLFCLKIPLMRECHDSLGKITCAASQMWNQCTCDSLRICGCDASWCNLAEDGKESFAGTSALSLNMTKHSNMFCWQTRPTVAPKWLRGLRIQALGSLEMTHYSVSLNRLVNEQPWVVHNLWCHYKLISATIALPLWQGAFGGLEAQHWQHGCKVHVGIRP